MKPTTAGVAMIQTTPKTKPQPSTRFRKIVTGASLTVLLLTPLATAVAAKPQLPTADGRPQSTVTITLDANDKGREFEGIGANDDHAMHNLYAAPASATKWLT